MKGYIQTIAILLLTLLISLLVSWATKITKTDSIFLVSLFVLISGCTMYLIQHSSTNHALQNFRRFFGSLNKSGQFIDEIERKNNEVHSYERKLPFTFSFIFSGSILTVSSFISSLLFV